MCREHISLQLGTIISHRASFIISHVTDSLLYWKWTREWLLFIPGGLPGSRSCSCPAHARVTYRTSLAQENTKTQNSKYSFYGVCITFAPSQSQKNLKLMTYIFQQEVIFYSVLWGIQSIGYNFSDPKDCPIWLRRQDFLEKYMASCNQVTK